MTEQQPLLTEKYPQAHDPVLPSAPYNENPSAAPPQGFPPSYQSPPAVSYQSPPAVSYQPPPAVSYQPPPAVSYQNPPPTATSNTTVVLTPGSSNVSSVQFGEHPVLTTCPNCHQQNTTTVSYTPGVLTFLLCGILLLFGFLLFCWIPLLVNGCKDVKHNCPNCRFPVGTYKRL